MGILQNHYRTILISRQIEMDADDSNNVYFSNIIHISHKLGPYHLFPLARIPPRMSQDDSSDVPDDAC